MAVFTWDKELEAAWGRGQAVIISALTVAEEVCAAQADPEHCMYGRKVNWTNLRATMHAARLLAEL